jgi:tetratricopeptide (TPR) repeat protein
MTQQTLPYSRYRGREHAISAISAAKSYIALYPKLNAPTKEQHSMLAAAHYTLSLQEDIPTSHAKMHTNSTITLLQNLPERNQDFDSMMAKAYFKRAEFFENEYAYKAAGLDYQRALEVFKNFDTETLTYDDKLLLAKSAISIADLILDNQLDNPIDHYLDNQLEPGDITEKLYHPLYYVNKALEYLADIPKTNDEIWTTFAYAHQIAGLALSTIDAVEAKEAFRTAIAMAFKAEPISAANMLGDIYNSLGLLYEHQFRECPIQKEPPKFNDQSLIYFGIALFFTPSEEIPIEEDQQLLETVFETIYRALDPFLTPLSPTVLHDFIDALIFMYYCVADQTLPNYTLCQQLGEAETFETFAQHIFWLVSESYRREHHKGRLLEINQLHDSELVLDLDISLASLLNPSQNKVHYLKKSSCTVSQI